MLNCGEGTFKFEEILDDKSRRKDIKINDREISSRNSIRNNIREEGSTLYSDRGSKLQYLERFRFHKSEHCRK